jgi:nucleoside-diphosphate-sugar epimerase
MSKKKIKIIEGSGFLAKHFKKYSNHLKKLDVIIYAAGVSNSLAKNSGIFKRDLKRLKIFIKQNRKKIIYLSTYSIFDKSRNKSNYVKNKIKIENFIRKNCSKYIIVRFPELIGKNKNPNTLTNFFFNKIKYRKKFIIWKNAKRNLLDVEDAIKICLFFIEKNKDNNKVINILNKRFYSPLYIVKELENILKVKSKFTLLNIKLKKWKVYNSVNNKITSNLKISFGDTYLIKTLKKYYN